MPPQKGTAAERTAQQDVQRQCEATRTRLTDEFIVGSPPAAVATSSPCPAVRVSEDWFGRGLLAT
ncbi:hypothetical protein [Streptomyces canus]|uniref:hypothetical protein n=1 Tax=Streptomyces canus TaxID=58343 RepID=UPI00324C840F